MTAQPDSASVALVHADVGGFDVQEVGFSEFLDTRVAQCEPSERFSYNDAASGGNLPQVWSSEMRSSSYEPNKPMFSSSPPCSVVNTWFDDVDWTPSVPLLQQSTQREPDIAQNSLSLSFRTPSVLPPGNLPPGNPSFSSQSPLLAQPFDEEMRISPTQVHIFAS